MILNKLAMVSTIVATLNGCVIYPTDYPRTMGGGAEAPPLLTTEAEKQPVIIVIQYNPSDPEPTLIRESEDVLFCQQYPPPQEASPPSLPELDPNRRDDPNYLSSQLIDHIKDLRSYIDELDQKQRLQYQEYLDKCHP